LRKEVLEKRRRVLGLEHPDTLMSMHNLAISYDDLGRKQEAFELRKELEKWRKVL
jgi:hypothetical protein